VKLTIDSVTIVAHTKEGKKAMIDVETFANQITMQLMSDLTIIKRTQDHDFIALTSQNRSFSARCGQQMEKSIVEIDFSEARAMSMYDPMSTSFMLQKDRVNNNSILINEEQLLKILNKG
jgi:hypothetical protein